MANSTEPVSIHMPKYETQPVQFTTPTPGVSVDIADIQNYIREKAEKNLERCKSFEVSLPSSITGITGVENQIEFKSLFQTPTLDELEILSSNPDGSSIKLNDAQARSVKETGEFEVKSINFPGQSHRWKISKLLQSGVRTANQVFNKELSWAAYMLIIFAVDRVFSDCFSFKAVLRSWKQGLVSLIDALIGLPAVYSNGIDLQIENERNEFLLNELTPHESEKEMFDEFCAQIPILLDMMIEYNKYSRRRNKPRPPRMLPYPHHFVTPNNIDIDLRLHNEDLQTKLQTIISSLLSKSTPKNWFHTTKRRLINQYKNEQIESGLSKAEIAKRVEAQLNVEYVERVFQAIKDSRQIEQLSPGLGRLLVSQARAVLTMESVVRKLNEDLDNHLEKLRENLIREHPIKSKISRWIEGKIFEERVQYIHQREWDAHRLSIEQYETLGNRQAAYFIQRDLTFRKDHESILRRSIKRSTEPARTIKCSRLIWLPKNWIVERTYPEPVERIPTLFVGKTYSKDEEEKQTLLIHSDPDAQYQLRKHITYSTTTQYPFWRWKLFTLRAFCWISNVIYTLCLVVPFASPVSFRALLSPKPFLPNRKLNNNDLKLHPDPSSKTQTFISRLAALWNNVQDSRRKFEQLPDRGILGKNLQRAFNRLWNYVIKGFIGSVAVCIVYPIVCLVVPTVSFILGVLSPIWVPIGTLIFHILQILFYDANSAGEYGRTLFCVINIILTDFFLCGILQPIFVSVTLISTPIISVLLVIYALLHRCTRGTYDTIMYHLVVKRLARVPAHDSFLAQRIAGPGLAAQYFYQVSSPEVLAALEALIEQNQLKVYRSHIEEILMKPISQYREFFNEAFRPFSGAVQTTNELSVYNQMNEVVDGHIRDLRNTINNRIELLQLKQSHNHNLIRLTETDLTAVLMEGTQIVERHYPTRIFSYLSKDDIEKFWIDNDLEPNDWFGLTSKLLQELFCQDFLTPLEQTDVFYSLKVDHLTLSKYAEMIHSANIRDDLDVVTSIYLPESSYTIQHPSFNQGILNPNETILHMSTNYSENRRTRLHGRIYRYFNHEGKHLRSAKKLSKFVDYTSITCRFSIPIRLPHVAFVNITIFNRDNNNNSIATTEHRKISRQDIVQLIAHHKNFYDEPMLPICSSTIPSSSINDDLLMINSIVDNNEDDQLNQDIALLD